MTGLDASATGCLPVVAPVLTLLCWGPASHVMPLLCAGGPDQVQTLGQAEAGQRVHGGDWVGCLRHRLFACGCPRVDPPAVRDCKQCVVRWWPRSGADSGAG